MTVLEYLKLFFRRRAVPTLSFRHKQVPRWEELMPVIVRQRRTEPGQYRLSGRKISDSTHQ